jgi:hypothetical protein
MPHGSLPRPRLTLVGIFLFPLFYAGRLVYFVWHGQRESHRSCLNDISGMRKLLPNKPAAANPGWRLQFCREPGWSSDVILSGVAEPER